MGFKPSTNKTQLAELTHKSGYKIAGVGDSIMLGGSVENGIDGGSRILDEGWLQLFAVNAGDAHYVYNGGVAGERTDQMLIRVPYILSLEPDVLFILGGTNDAPTISPETIADNIESIVVLTKANKTLPVLMSIPPRGETDSNQTIIQANRLIANLADKYNCPFINFSGKLVDPTTGLMDATYSSDLIHPNIVGKRIIADEILTQFWNYQRKMPLVLTESNVDTDSINSNALFMTDATSDGKPDGWNVSVNNTSLLIADEADVVGNWWKLTTTSTSQAVNSKYAAVGNGYEVGDILRFSGRVKTIDSESTGVKFTVGLQFYGVSQQIRPISDISSNVDGVFSIDVKVPVGTTGIDINILLRDAVGDLFIGQLDYKVIS